MIGYGGMLMESFVAIMALCRRRIARSRRVFRDEQPRRTDRYGCQHRRRSNYHQAELPVDAATLLHTAKEVGENTILSRTGGAPTLAVGMAHIMSRLIPGEAMMAFWYHFALLFEALFILTAVDAGTRVARFMIQDLGSIFYKPFGNTDSIPANLIATFFAVALWGYFLYTGVTDPLGGINSLYFIRHRQPNAGRRSLDYVCRCAD